MNIRFRILGALALTVAMAACGDVVRPSLPEEELSDQLFLFAALDADSTRHWIEVSPVDSRDEHLPGVSVAIYKLSAAAGWEVVAVTDSARRQGIGTPTDELGHCFPLLYNNPGTRCLAPEVALEPGATYKVEAKTDHHVAAWGTTTVPGDFGIEAAALDSTAGAPEIAVDWTFSMAAHRYMLGLRRRTSVCSNCSRAWVVDLDSTHFAGPIPQIVLDSAGPSPTIDVMAIDRHAHAFFTSGHGDQMLTVHPVQNVEGGFGLVGSLRIRSRRVGAGRS